VTWHKLDIPAGDPIRFINRSDGWTAGNELYATRDGGRTWQRQPVSLPPDYTSSFPAYDLPTFQNAQNGVLPVSFTGGEHAAIGFYSTRDGGRSWRLAARIPSPDRLERGVRLISNVIDGATWVVSSFSGKRLDKTQDAGKTVKAISPTGLQAGLAGIDFATPTVGWARTETSTCTGFKSGCSTHIQLLRTTNGGQNWHSIISTSALTTTLGAVALDMK
jgi:photosystem II stability/assembly factor-like uncharacterized protein